MLRHLDSGDGASERDSHVSAALQAAVVTEHAPSTAGGARVSDGGSSVDLVALVRQWTLSLRRLVSALLSARHGAGSTAGAGSTFRSLHAWIPELGTAAELLTQRVSNARMLVSQLQRLCPELASSIDALNSEIAACEAAVTGSTAHSSSRAAATPSRSGAPSRDHLAQATPAGAYGPKSLQAFHTRTHRSAPSSASRGRRGPGSGSGAAGLMTAVRPTKHARLASTVRRGTAAARPRLSPHAELSPARETHSASGADAGVPAAARDARPTTAVPQVGGRGGEGEGWPVQSATGARGVGAIAAPTPARGAGLVRHLTFGED